MVSRVIRSVLALAALAGCGGTDATMPPDTSPGWGAAEVLGSTEYLGSLAGDANGNVVLTWIPPPAPGTGASIVARRFTAAAGWAPTQIVAAPGPNVFQSPAAAMDPGGAARVVWPTTAGLLTSGSAGSGWDAPRLISSPASSFHALPAVSLPATNTALAVWTGGSLSTSDVSASRLDPVLGWLQPETVWGIGARDVSAPALAAASTGFALVAWAEGRDGGARLWWTTFDPHRGWAVAQLLGLATDARLVYGVRVAFDAAGEGALAWTQDDTVFASRFTTVEGPGLPDAIGRGGCQGLAVSPAGTVMALLNQPLVPLAGFVLRVFQPGRGWDPVPAVVAEDAGGAGALSMDTLGNAWLVWANTSGVWARRYVSGQGLGPVQPIVTGRFALLPQVVATTDGGAIAAWLERSSDAASATILAARYVAP